MINQEQNRRPIVSIVDDDVSVRESAQMLFESADFDAEVFRLTKILRRKCVRVGLFDLDVQLPA